MKSHYMVAPFLAIVATLTVVSALYGERNQEPYTPAPYNESSYDSSIVEGQEITRVGTAACLPHVDTSGPQTLECAIGLYVENDGYYKLINSGQLSTGTTYTVTGTYIEQSPYEMYNVVGGIYVETATANQVN